MIPRPVRYRARRLPEGPPTVDFQQAEGERWFPLATVVDDLPFGWGPGAPVEHARHLASALLLSRVSLGEASELVDDMAGLVERMPVEGWEMTGASLGRVVARLILGEPVPDPTFSLDIEEQRLAALFGTPTCSCGWRYKPNGGTFECLNPNCPVGETDIPHGLGRDGSADIRLMSCPCGQPLPVHLADLRLTAHVCICRRRYRVEAGVFIPDGAEFNPFAEAGRG